MAETDLVVGIDLGTTHSLVSVVDSGFPIVLADGDGRRILPSVVSYQDSGDVLVGSAALRNRVVAPEQTIGSVKRVIGRSYSSLSQEEIETLPFSIEQAEGDQIAVRIGKSGTKSPEEISAEILARLKQTAEAAMEQPLEYVVITVPAYFNHRQREATRQAAELAGWSVKRIINEPTAAALAYGLDRGADHERVAVYDLGGGTFDLSILELREGIFEVIATAGDTRLGGDDIDRAVAVWLQNELGLSELTLSAEQQAKIDIAARRAKEDLSTEEQVSIELPFFDGSQSYSTSLDRATLESLALPWLEKTRTICQKAFLEAEHKGAGEIDHLILVGGSTQMPLVREKLQEWFGTEPDVTQHPDEAIAIGAGLQAGILCGRVRQVVLLDVVPLSLGIETIGGLMNVIIPRNTTIPAKAGEMFTNAVPNQSSMAVRILQGEREMAADNWLLGDITVPFEPSPKGGARVGVQFEIDENGLLTVLARDTKTGIDLTLSIENAAVDVTDEAVEQMVSESIEHAFDDMNQRILTEVRMKSEELLPAVDTALAMIGDKLPAEQRQQIEQAAQSVRLLTEQENPPVAELKSANQVLDDSTQHLAALLVEQAMDQAFE